MISDKNIKKTPRGFNVYGRFIDSYNSEIRVQESSNVDGGIWIFCNNEQFKDMSPHLTVDQAKELITLLEKAVKVQS